MSNSDQLQGMTPGAHETGSDLFPPVTYSKPYAFTVIDWLFIPPTLFFAGASLTSTQDNAAGGQLTSMSSSGAIFHDHLILGALCVSAALAMLVKGPVIFRALRRNWWLSLTLALAWISCAWSQKPTQSVRGCLGLTGTTIIAVWITRRFDADRRMQLLMRVGTVAAIASVLVAVVFPGRGLDTLNEHNGALQGIFLSKNHCARAMVFLLTAGLHKGSTPRPTRWLYCALIIGVIVMTRSVTGIVLAGFYIVYLVAIRIVARFPRKESALLVAFWALPIVAALLTADIWFRLLGRDITLSHRTMIWGILLASASKRPWLGYGFNGFWIGNSGEGFSAFTSVFVQSGGFAMNYSHSGYIDVLLQLGLLGVGVIALGVVLAMIASIRTIGIRMDNAQRWYLGIVLLTILYNIVEVTFLQPMQLTWMLFLMAFISLRGERTHPTSEFLAAV